jgi:uncharacterized RDD family membrane protein YckC
MLLQSAASPPLRRRLAAMLYEALLLFGVVFATGLLFDTLTQSRHALMLRHVRQLILFIVLGLYFVFFWSRGGQTLAMKTWRIRLITENGERVRPVKAFVRYLLAWMWFLPAVGLDYALGLKGWTSVCVLATGMLLWAATIRLNPDRQFLHDTLAGTRLISYETPLPLSKQ